MTGDIRDGGTVRSHFLAMGKVWVADHIFIHRAGHVYGWSDPLTGEFSGVRDHHLFRVESASPSLTRFIQSDDFTGETAAQHGVALARVGFDNYPIFNQELTDEVMCRRKAAKASDDALRMKRCRRFIRCGERATPLPPVVDLFEATPYANLFDAPGEYARCFDRKPPVLCDRHCCA